MKTASSSALRDLRVLMLSGEQLLLAPAQPQPNDAQRRHVQMASSIASLDVVVLAHGSKESAAWRPGPNVWLHPAAGRTRAGGYFRMLRVASVIARERNVDLVTTEDPFVFGLIGLMLKIRHGIALNAQLHADVIANPYWVRKRPLIRRLLGALGAVVLRRSDSVRVVSSKVEDVVRSICGPAKPLYLIPTGGGIQLEAFDAGDPDRVRARFAPSGECLFLSVGRLAIEKDHDSLLRAVEIVSASGVSAHFLVVGGGEEEQRLGDEIIRRGLSNTVSLIGYVPYDELPAYFAASDVFVLTSLYEGMGRVLIEAAAAGLPIISTDVGIARDLVNHGRDGFIVQIEDAVALAESIEKLATDPALRQRFVANARDKDLHRFDRRFVLDEIPKMWADTSARYKIAS